MSFFSLLLIAFSLAMDAFAVSVTAGCTSKRVRLSRALALAGIFGLFQGLMPLLGWLGAQSVAGFIEPIDHWIAFGLLSFLGVNMLREAWSHESEKSRDYFSISSLLVLGIATSIDALAVGVSLALVSVDILLAIAMIAGVTALLCLGGVYLGARFGQIFGQKALILGGLILIAMGSSILWKHIVG